MRKSFHGWHLFVEDALVHLLVVCSLYKELGHNELILAIKASNHHYENAKRLKSGK